MKALLFMMSLFLFIPFESEGSGLKFQGRILSQSQADFKLIDLPDKTYQLEIKPQGASKSCLYQVKKISAPRQTRGMNGIVFANRIEACQFQIKDKLTQDFWNSIVLIDFNYRLKNAQSFEGKALLKSMEKEYSASLAFE